MIAVCKIDGANAFVWSAPPLFANQLASSMIMNGTKSLAFFSFFTTTGRSTLIANETSTINATIMIRCHDDFNRKTQTATVEVVGKRD